MNAEIQIGDEPLNLTATSVSIEHVTIRNLVGGSPSALVKVRSQQLNLLNCEFVTGKDSGESASETSADFPALIWTSPAGEAGSRQIDVKNTRFDHDGTAIHLGQPPKSVHIHNTLKTGTGTFVAFDAKCRAIDTKLELDRVTMRGSGPLLRLTGQIAETAGTPSIPLEVNNSVFQLVSTQTGLVVVESERPRQDVDKIVRMTANESVVAPGTTLLTTHNPIRNQFSVIDASDQFEGLTANGIEFVGKNLQQVHDSQTARLDGARHASMQMPGIDPAQFASALHTRKSQSCRHD